MFPEELLIEILKRLPVKSLYRCMSVCESWHSLITSSHFIHTHLNYQKDLSRGNILPKTCGLYSLDNCYHWRHFDSSRQFYAYSDDGCRITKVSAFDCPVVSDQKTTLCCCDGMVCFLCYFGPRKIKYFTIWNPSQRKSIQIDFPRVRTGASDHVPGVPGVRFACGFEFDSSRNDYKVVTLIRNRNLRLSVYVYSLRARTWKAMNTTISLPVSRWISATADYVKDVVYWTTPRSVLTYNLADEKLSEIPFPEGYVKCERSPILPITICVRGKEFLGVCCSYNADTVLWVMDECGKVDSWREFVKISCGWFAVVQNVRVNGEILLEVDGKPFVSFDPKKMKACVVCCQPKGENYLGFFVESLVPLG